MYGEFRNVNVNTLKLFVNAWELGAGEYWDILAFLKWVLSAVPTI